LARRHLNLFGHEPLIHKLEQGQQEHNFRSVERNLPKREAIMREMMEYQYEPGAFEHPAREIRERHGSRREIQ